MLKNVIPAVFRISPAVLILCMLAASCSRDDSIIGDYKIYDLDGSNQAIIGKSGLVNVSDITSYKLEGRRIYFETGVLNAPPGEAAQVCKYGFIDTAAGLVVPAGPKSSLQGMIVSKLAEARKGVVSRSCVSKNLSP